MNDINKCPICGSEGETDIVGIGSGQYIVDCSNPKCILSKFGHGSKNSVEIAIKDWNRCTTVKEKE